MDSLPRGLFAVIALVCALHVMLLWGGLAAPDRAGLAFEPSKRMSTRWIEAPAVQNSEVDVADEADAVEKLTPRRFSREASRLPRRMSERRAMGGADPEAVDAHATADAADPAADASMTEAKPPESAAPGLALGIDAIRRAARITVQQGNVAAMSDARLGVQPVGAQSALRAGVASAARTDCLKGGDAGYARQGLGLFAVPLLVIDAARGRCTR